MNIFALLTALAAIAKEAGVEIEIGKHLSLWDASTGLPISFPSATPYPYTTGDWFWVSEVAAVGGTNYKPAGTVYDGTASTTPETETVVPLDIYIYDGNGVFNLFHVGTLLSKYYTKEQVDALIGTVKTELDATLVPNTTYTIGARSSSLSLALPASAEVGKMIVVMFKATGAFTPTITGTYSGETPYATTSGKHYTYMLVWNGEAWELSTTEA